MPQACNETWNGTTLTSRQMAVTTSLKTQLPGKKTTESGIHRASTLAGPWQPINQTAHSNWSHCNNPSPFVAPNGSLVLACTWSLRHARQASGPWSDDIQLSPPQSKERHWEDPFLYIDSRGRWHLLAHTYSTELSTQASVISGHAFSEDGSRWHFSSVQPYGPTVQFTDGTSRTFATLERPKLFFNASGYPTHIYNGASPVSPPCAVCGYCAHCKVGERMFVRNRKRKKKRDVKEKRDGGTRKRSVLQLTWFACCGALAR